MVMGKEGPLLTCMVVEVLGAVWMVEVVPGRLVTVNAGFRASCIQSKENSELRAGPVLQKASRLTAQAEASAPGSRAHLHILPVA